MIKDCPRTDIVRVNGFCTDCGILHFIVDCPNHPDKRPATTLNVLSTIPSSGNEEELNVSAKVVTRAQRKRSKKTTQEKENPDQLSVSDRWRER